MKEKFLTDLKRRVRLHELEIIIAYSAARTDIETICIAVTEDGKEPETVEEIRSCWYDVSRLRDKELEKDVERSLEYLSLRGLIKHYSGYSSWVRVLDDNA